MSLKMKKKQKNGAVKLTVSHSWTPAGSAGKQNVTEKHSGAGLSGIGRSFSGLLDRTRAYFRQGTPAEN
jgi:hypothetical protein